MKEFEQRKLYDLPPEVIQRWVRIKMISKGPVLARWYMRKWLPIKERKRRIALEEAFNAIKKQAIDLEHSDFESSKVFINIALYFLLAERDIQSIKIDALTHPDVWKRNLALRTMLLTVHEWDMDKVAGKNLKLAMNQVAINEVLQKEVIGSLRDVRKVQQRARKALNHARNVAIAHRDPDALLQYRTIRDLDGEVVMNLAVEFHEGASRFITVLPNLIMEGGSIGSLLKQLSKV